MAEWMQSYLKEVRAQLIWKRAHPVVLRELQNHLQDQYEACLADGLTRSEAEEETLRQMGDPVSVGKALNLVHRPKIAWEIVITIALLLICSLCLWVFVFSEVSHWSMDHWLWTPLWATMLGCVMCVLTARLDMNALSKRSWMIYCGGLLIMGGAVLYSVAFLAGGTINGINYLGHYAAVFLPVSYSCAVYALRNKGGKGLALSIAALLPLALLCWISHSLWSLLCLSISALVMLLVSNYHGSFGHKKGRNTVVIVGVSMFSVLVYLLMSYEQLAYRIRPLSDGLESNLQWQYIQGLLRHSRPFGPGDAFSIAAVSFQISADQNQLLLDDVLSTDFLLAGVSYLCGWVVALVLVVAVVVFLVFLLRRSLKQKMICNPSSGQ